MAANSKRERIIVKVKTLLETLGTINTVVRRKQTYSELDDFALTQLPVAAVVGRMPKTPSSGITTHISRRTSVDVVISELRVDVFVYAQDKETPDTTISNLADDLWALLYADQKLGGLVIELRLELEENAEYWEPFLAFKITVVTKYKHDTGGI